MVFDRLLVVLEGIHALLIRVPLYKHATEEFSERRSRYAVDKTSKQTAEAVEQSASTFPPHLTRPHTLLLVRRLKIWCAARRSILGASTVGSFHAVHSGSAFRTPWPSRTFRRPCAVLCNLANIMQLQCVRVQEGRRGRNRAQSATKSATTRAGR